MFGLPADAVWIWVGLVVGSAAMFGAITAIPAPPPDATHVSGAIDEVAASPHSGFATVEIRADAIELAPNRVGVKGPGGRAHDSLSYGPVTPVEPGTPLQAVLQGQPPETVFDTPAALANATATARSVEPTWRSNGSVVRIRRVRYGEVNCVLVGT